MEFYSFAIESCSKFSFIFTSIQSFGKMIKFQNKIKLLMNFIFNLNFNVRN